MSETQYQPTWLDKFFHSFPHINLSFQYTNSTFNPQESSYREALGFFTALPVLWCLISLLLFSCYYVVQCCRNKPKKRRKTGCLKVFIGLMILLGCTSLAFGFFGNEKANDGVDKVITAIGDTNQTLHSAKRTISLLDDMAEKIADFGAEALQNVTDRIGNLTVRGQIQKLIQVIILMSKDFRTDIKIIQDNTNLIDLHNVKTEIDSIEFYRWLSTLILYIVFVFLNLMFLIGITRSAKGMLVAASILSLCFLILMWSAAGFYIGVSMAAGDLCVDPDAFVMRIAPGTLPKDVLVAYLKCPDPTKPFSNSIFKAHAAAVNASQALNQAVTLAKPFNISGEIKQPVQFLRTELKLVVSNLTALNDVANCEHIHSSYIHALNGFCDTAVIGLAFMLLMSLISGLTVTFAIAFASRTWPHFGKRRGYYPVDDTDPFLPRPPPYESYGTMRSYDRDGRSSIPSVSRRSLSINDEHHGASANLPMGESPPPAYHPGKCSSMQQYHNLAPHPGAMQASSET